MPKKISIQYQAEAQATYDEFAVEATRLESIAGDKAPARPKPTGDILADTEDLEVHVACLSALTRFHRPTPAPVVASTIAKPIAAKVKPLTATERAQAAIAARPTATKASVTPAPKAAPAVRKPTATERVLASPEYKAKCSIAGSRMAEFQPVAVAPAKVKKVFVPLPAQFADTNEPVRELGMRCADLEVCLHSHRKTFKRPARTGDDVADTATLTAYHNALVATFHSLTNN